MATELTIDVTGLTKRFGQQTAVDALDLRMRPGEVHALLGPNGSGKTTQSGGMRRRVDLLAGLVVRPAVLFLDEPTTGLDPRSRNQIHEQIKDFVADGTSVLLTTQYLDEADRLADHLTILDRGSTVATGTPTQVKQRVDATGSGAVTLDEAFLALTDPALPSAAILDQRAAETTETAR